MIQWEASSPFAPPGIPDDAMGISFISLLNPESRLDFQSLYLSNQEM
jgi:hypothetical protein